MFDMAYKSGEADTHTHTQRERERERERVSQSGEKNKLMSRDFYED